MSQEHKIECLANFLNLSVDSIMESSDHSFYGGDEKFAVGTPEEVYRWARVVMLSRIHEFSVNEVISNTSLVSYAHPNGGDDIMDGNELKKAIQLVLNNGSDEQKAAFILQLVEPSGLNTMIEQKLDKMRESNDGFGPLFAQDEKEHYSRQYDLYIYRY